MDKSTQAYLWAFASGAILIVMFLVAVSRNEPAKAPSPPVRPPAPIATAPKPPPTKAELAEARKAQQQAQAEALTRAVACRELESRLVDTGYDVQVILMSDNNRNMVIYGPGVTRLMARQMATQSSGRQLKKIGFVKVVFMRSQYDWVGEWDVFYNTIRLAGD